MVRARCAAFAVLVLLAVGALSAGSALAGEEKGKPQTECPVMGGKISKKLFVDHGGRRIYFCCPGCIDTFKKDPEKYVKKMADEGVEVESITKPQTECPVTGKPIDREVSVEHDGKRIYFCSPGCIKEFRAHRAKYLDKMKRAGVKLESLEQPQTRCPITGRPIDKECFVDLKAWRVYTCCPKCLGQVRRDPAAALKAIKDNGETPEKRPAARKMRHRHRSEHPKGAEHPH
jgi:YHS domain-containing protein